MLRSILVVISVLFLAGDLQAQEDENKLDPVAARELIRQWVKTESLISEEKTAWSVERKRMESLLGVYRKELLLLNEELEKAGGSAELVDQDKEKLAAELKEYRAAQRLLGEVMARLLPRMKGVLARLPQTLLDDLSSDVEKLNAPDALSQPRDVLRSMIAVLTAAERFNRSVTVVEETREVTGGKKVSVNVMYLGLARAFYAADAGVYAGVGSPGKDGWVWQEDGAIAEDVRRALAVYRKDKQPQMVKLPIKLDEEVGE